MRGLFLMQLESLKGAVLMFWGSCSKLFSSLGPPVCWGSCLILGSAALPVPELRRSPPILPRCLRLIDRDTKASGTS